MLHGLAGTGAVVVLLLAALPSQLEASLALAVFAPMSIVSMAPCTTAFAWLLTRRVIDPIYRTVLIPAFGLFGIAFGLLVTGGSGRRHIRARRSAAAGLRRVGALRLERGVELDGLDRVLSGGLASTSWMIAWI